MRVKNKSACFKRFTPGITVVFMMLSLIFSQGVSFASQQNKPQNGEAVTRGTPTPLQIQNQSENFNLPAHHTGMPQNLLFSKIADSSINQEVDILKAPANTFLRSALLKHSAEQAAKDSAKQAAKDSAKQTAKDVAKQAAQQAAQQAAKETGKETAKDSAKKRDRVPPRR